MTGATDADASTVRAPRPEDALPGFRLLFPAGWARFDADEAGERELLAATRAKLKPVGRPDLDFELTAQLKASLRRLRTQGGFAMYLAVEPPGGTPVPMSITAAVVSEPDGRSLDQRVTAMIRDGAGFLGEDRAILRRRASVAPDPRGFGVPATQLDYLVPVPGTGRRSALLFSSVVLDVAGAEDPELAESLVELSDAVIGTFAWAPGA